MESAEAALEDYSDDSAWNEFEAYGEGDYL